jgi:hypothetical protein
MVAAAIAGAAVVGAVASSSAADKQSHAANSATASQQGMYDQTVANEAPYRTAGASATGRLGDLLGTSGNTKAAGYGSLTTGFTGADYLANQDPGYQFQLDQGTKALQNSQAANGGVLSGAALKDLIGYNQGMASTGYQNAWNRWNTQQGNTYSRLGSLAQLGQSAASNQASGASTFAGGIANTITGAGNAQASGTVGAANALSNGATNLAGYYYLNAGSKAPPVTTGSDPNGYNGTQNNPSAYVGGP